MPRPDLDAIRALRAGITPPPWRERFLYKHDPPGVLVAATAPGHHVVSDAQGGSYPSNDLRFIATAPTIVDDLLAYIEELELERQTRTGEDLP